MRRKLLARRRALSDEEVGERSRALTEALVAHELWQRARAVAGFIGVRKEPDTRLLLQRGLDAGKRIWLPRVLGPGRMRFWPVRDLADLEVGPMGLREPAKLGEGLGAPGPERGVDLVLVPGLGFGRDGARLGFGAGHYDRAFGARRDRPELEMPAFVGVGFSACFDPFGDPAHDPTAAIPMLDHDLTMDFLVSEAGVLRCG